MTPEDKALLDRAIEACNRGPSHAADRIILFPQVVELVTRAVALNARFRNAQRKLDDHVRLIKRLSYRAQDWKDNDTARHQHLLELDAAWEQLRDILEEIRREP